MLCAPRKGARAVETLWEGANRYKPHNSRAKPFRLLAYGVRFFLCHGWKEKRQGRGYYSNGRARRRRKLSTAKARTPPKKSQYRS